MSLEHARLRKRRPPLRTGTRLRLLSCGTEADGAAEEAVLAGRAVEVVKPAVGLLLRDDARFDRPRGRLRKLELSRSDVVVGEDVGVRLNADVDEAGLYEKPSQTPTDHRLADAEAVMSPDRAAEDGVGAADQQTVPVRLHHRDAAAALEYSRHLSDRVIGIGQMLEHPFGPARVELPGLERQLLCVRQLERHAVQCSVTARGLRDHRLRRVHPDRTSRRSYNRSERSDVVSRPTADVEYPMAASYLEPLENPLLRFRDRPNLAADVQVLDQVRRRNSRIAAEAMPDPGRPALHGARDYTRKYGHA